MLHLKQAIYPLLILAPLAFLVVPAQAVTYYVATTGSNGNTCIQAQNQNTPKQTIPAGVACLVSGDTLIVKAGTYTLSGTGVGMIQNPPAGTASAYTTIKRDPNGPRPVFSLQWNPTGTYQFGFLCTNGSSCHHIEVRGFEFVNAYAGVDLQGSDVLGYAHYINFVDNVVHDTYAQGMVTRTSKTGFMGGDHLIRGNEWYKIGIHRPGYLSGNNTIYNPGNRSIVENNSFHNLVHGVGIWTDRTPIQGVLVRNNLFYNIGRIEVDTWQEGCNGSTAIHVSVPGGGHQIYNNIIYNSGSATHSTLFKGIRIGTQADNTSTTQIYHNTIFNLFNSGGYAILDQVGIGTIKNNIAHQAALGISGGTQSNNLLTNPSFVDPGKGNFRLQSGSAAIDAGVTIQLVKVDYEGTPRPQAGAHDIGAYEGNVVAGAAPAAPRNLSVR
jgi:hypothetical protein